MLLIQTVALTLRTRLDQGLAGSGDEKQGLASYRPWQPQAPRELPRYCRSMNICQYHGPECSYIVSYTSARPVVASASAGALCVLGTVSYTSNGAQTGIGSYVQERKRERERDRAREREREREREGEGEGGRGEPERERLRERGVHCINLDFCAPAVPGAKALCLLHEVGN